jgi:ABC-type uncharacterized transport system permease subunit
VKPIYCAIFAQIYKMSGLYLTATLLYSISGFVLFRRLISATGGTSSKSPVLILSVAAVLIHGIIIYTGMASHDQWNLGMTSTFSIITWAVAGIFTGIAIWRPIENLGVAVMPAAAIAVLVTWLWPAGTGVLVSPSAPFTLHLVVSVMAYAFLTLAVVQALLLNIQESRLRQREPGRLLKALPPIQTMEGALFLFTGIGFILLTLTLVSGAIYAQSLFGTSLAFNHHTVLTLIAWVIFGILLVGHFRFGWRGRHAAHWTIGGFAVLVLAYFGTKYVVEFLLA